MVVTHLIYDRRSLLSCSLTCYSWYTVSVPHLHHTLVAQTFSRGDDTRLRWPKPLREASKLGVLPLVKKFGVHVVSFDAMFSRKRFNWRTLRQFSALTNVRTLSIDYLDIPSFIPRIRRYFGHFAPTVRSLALMKPEGTSRQIIFFIGLFQHLEDLKLLYDVIHPQEGEPAEGPTLVPSFIPPLRGRLTITCFRKLGLLEDMIDLFGGIRFRCVDIFNVKGTRLLLGACAETLETLRLCPTDPHGKGFSLNMVQAPTDKFKARSFLRDFDLSRNKSLRTLQVTAWSGDALRVCSPAVAARLLTYAISTITSPVFTEVTAIYREYHFCVVESAWPGRPRLRRKSSGEKAVEASWHGRRFEAFRRMHKVRDFRLVLCADVWEGVGEYSVRSLEKAVAAERAGKGFDGTFPEPLVVCRPRASCPKPPRRTLF